MRASVRHSLGALLFAAVAFVGASGASMAFAQHYDVFATSSGGAIVVGGYDDDTGTALIPAEQMQVFEGEVVGDIGGGIPYESEAPGEPGFRASSQTSLNNPSLTTPANVYTALPASTPLTFSFLPFTVGSNSRNLFFWDGTGAVDFAPASSSVVLGLTKPGGGGWTESINGSSNSLIAGNTIQDTSSTGTVHTHLFTSIGNAGSAPDQGFYLFSMQLEMAGLATSEPLYFVYGALDPANLQYGQTLVDFEDSHALAATWVQDTLVAPVPEPSTYALMGLAAAAIPLVRRFRGRR